MSPYAPVTLHASQENTAALSSLKDDDAWPEPSLQDDVYELIRDIKDPEYPYSLEHLNVVSREQVNICTNPNDDCQEITVTFTPTVPHCHLANLIGLCIRVQLEKCLRFRYKLIVNVAPGSHETEHDINKQINDKERSCAAMENPDLLAIVNECLMFMG